MVGGLPALFIYEVLCPYCQFRNETLLEVAETRRVDMPDHLRRYLVAVKILGWQGNSLRADIAAYKSRVAKATASLERHRPQRKPKRWRLW
jgi:hypothetical protein